VARSRQPSHALANARLLFAAAADALTPMREHRGGVDGIGDIGEKEQEIGWRSD
jgi:hypothetical protein